jgi:F0F1-type ATP synthase assembly protein I
VIAPVLLGRWLDSHTGKDPWFTLGGFVLGGAAAFRSALRAASELRRGQEEGGESSTPGSST